MLLLEQGGCTGTSSSPSCFRLESIMPSWALCMCVQYDYFFGLRGALRLPVDVYYSSSYAQVPRARNTVNRTLDHSKEWLFVTVYYFIAPRRATAGSSPCPPRYPIRSHGKPGLRSGETRRTNNREAACELDALFPEKKMGQVEPNSESHELQKPGQRWVQHRQGVTFVF